MPYKYKVFYGNNCTIVNKVFEKRPEWMRVEEHSEFSVNFIWKPVSWGLRFDKPSIRGSPLIYNHFEFHG